MVAHSPGIGFDISNELRKHGQPSFRTPRPSQKTLPLSRLKTIEAVIKQSCLFNAGTFPTHFLARYSDKAQQCGLTEKIMHLLSTQMRLMGQSGQNGTFLENQSRARATGFPEATTLSTSALGSNSMNPKNSAVLLNLKPTYQMKISTKILDN